MTLEEAEKVLSNHAGYIGDTYPDCMCLDGWFTVEQLEAVITVMRAAQGKEVKP